MKGVAWTRQYLYYFGQYRHLRTRRYWPFQIKTINKITNDLEVARPQSGSSCTWFLVELEFGNVGFWGEGKTGVQEEKPLGAHYCLRADVSCFLCCKRKRVPFPRATKATGDVCTQAKQMREPTTNSTHVWSRRQDLRNPGQIGGRRAFSPLRHPLLPIFDVKSPNLPILAQNRFVN